MLNFWLKMKTIGTGNFEVVLILLIVLTISTCHPVSNPKLHQSLPSADWTDGGGAKFGTVHQAENERFKREILFRPIAVYLELQPAQRQQQTLESSSPTHA
ncbi:uncharacterized protein LOC129722300 [Wyeomyia smithii]|uniref:uncharacterized protein LOC129722300 n=1 Tax=Wyeomyia smithii TaxID=174621 RepID=UPI002467F421|nr:uncharacterized protein LOC129722300 [Wyeomyia smithii]